MKLLKSSAFLFLISLSAASWAAERVVAVGGDITEIVFALGEGHRMVANDSTSVYPAAAATLPKVGYVRQLSAEGVLSVEPDLLLISGAAGPPAALELLEGSGVDIVAMETAYDVDAIIAKTRTVAAALDAEQAGAEMIAKIEADWASARDAIGSGLDQRMLFFAAPPRGAPRAAGRDTAAQGIIDMLGGENVFADHTGYKPLSLEAAVAADPDLILVMHHHADLMGGLQAVLEHPALSLTSAAQAGRVYLVDPVTVMQFGPRTPAAVAQLAAEITGDQTQP